MQDNAIRPSARHSSGSSKTSRAFSPQVERSLAKAIADYNPESSNSDDAVRMAVISAATEARSQLWRPDELVIALRAAVPEAELAPGVRDALLALLKRRALVAFFGQQEGGF